MKPLFLKALSALVLAMPMQIASARDIPDGVVLKPATTDSTSTAESTLRRLLDDRSTQAWTEAFAISSADDLPGFMLGMFSSQDLEGNSGFELDRTMFGKGKVSLTADIPLEYRLIGAGTAEQRDYIAKLLLPTIPDGQPDEIRIANFHELALIWYFISWDIDEPLLIARWGEHRVAFDFDSTGRHLAWIERLSQPCFSLGTEEGKTLLECHCINIARDEMRWELRFAPMDTTLSCPK